MSPRRWCCSFAPPAAPFHVSEPRPAQQVVLVELPVDWVGDAHPTPAPHLLACLSGSFRMTASSGETRSFGPGDALLMEDTSGVGHSTEVISAEPVRALMIRLGGS